MDLLGISMGKYENPGETKVGQFEFVNSPGQEKGWLTVCRVAYGFHKMCTTHCKTSKIEYLHNAGGSRFLGLAVGTPWICLDYLWENMKTLGIIATAVSLLVQVHSAAVRPAGRHARVTLKKKFSGKLPNFMKRLDIMYLGV